MTQEEIYKNCQMIQKAIDIQIPLGDIDAIEGKMLELVALMGLSAEVMTEAKRELLGKQGVEIDVIRAGNPNINPSTLKLILESKLAREATMYQFAERLNSALVHAVDGLRTSISKYKMEREISTYGK